MSLPKKHLHNVGSGLVNRNGRAVAFLLRIGRSLCARWAVRNRPLRDRSTILMNLKHWQEWKRTLIYYTNRSASSGKSSSDQEFGVIGLPSFRWYYCRNPSRPEQLTIPSIRCWRPAWRRYSTSTTAEAIAQYHPSFTLHEGGVKICSNAPMSRKVWRYTPSPP